MTERTVLAIDPGNRESAYALIGQDRRPLAFSKLPNQDLLGLLRDGGFEAEFVAVEMVAAYGMAVGADVFETCVWTGRFAEALDYVGYDTMLVKRHPVKMHHCRSAKAKDSDIRHALVDRFAPGTRNYGKGVKDAPGWFYGFHDDVWSAYAIAVYVADLHLPAAEAEAESDGLLSQIKF